MGVLNRDIESLQRGYKMFLFAILNEREGERERLMSIIDSWMDSTDQRGLSSWNFLLVGDYSCKTYFDLDLQMITF